ncbi:hypothetical protein J2S58_003134 [Nakamurella flavida]|nr:hypothetical protein [Nakamurella flavida]MDP9779511.1 hypothetical protein [Nakamurella flavida]
MTGEHTAHAPVVGEMEWTLADGRLHLTGDAVPTVELVLLG